MEQKNRKEPTFDIMDYFSAIRILAAIIISLLIVFVLIFFVSDDPYLAIYKMMLGPLQTKRSIFNVLERATPLIFTGLALNISLRSGVFNIGSDGAFYMGAVLGSAVALKLNLPNVVHQLLAVIVAAMAGGIINMLPVIVERYTRIRATVLSIMLNSIFFYLGLSIVSSFLLEKSGSWGSEPFPDTAKFGNMIKGTSMHWGFLILLAAIIFIVILMEKTPFGYKVRVTGLNPDFAKSAGIKTGSVMLGAQFIGGTVAGAGGAVEMLGMYKRFQWQSQVNYVWDGLLVHMLANQNPIFIPFTAIFIAYLRIGAEIMSRATDLDPEVVAFLQGIVILLAASEKFLYPIKRRYEQKQALAEADFTMDGGV